MNEEKSDMSPVKETPGQGLKASEMNNESKGMFNESSDNFSYAQNLIVSNFVLDEVISEKEEESKQEYTGDLHSVMEEKEPFRVDPEISQVQIVPDSPEVSMRANENILQIVPEEDQPEASVQSAGNPTHIIQDYDIPNEPSEVQYRHQTSQDEIPEPQESAEERLQAEQAERERREREAIEHAEKRALDIKKAEMDALRELQGEMGEIEGKANDILSRYNS